VTHVTSTLGDVPLTLNVLKSVLRSLALQKRGESAPRSALCTHQSMLRNTAGRRSGLRYFASERLLPAMSVGKGDDAAAKSRL
jgi:hypothetical protein